MISRCRRNLCALAAFVALSFVADRGVAKQPQASGGKPLKVFILAGQSNMQGHAQVRTIDAMRLNPKAAPLLDTMRDSDGEWRVCERTWISSLGAADEVKTGPLTVGFGAANNGPKIGPEFTFGLAIEAMLDEPVLIIKTAWGGKSLHTDFRPPGAGAYEFDPRQRELFEKQGKDIRQISADKVAATGRYYRDMLGHVEKVLADISSVHPDYDASHGYELAGFVWFQGWNDMVDRGTYPDRDQPGGYDQYSRLLSQFIRDVRKELNTPELPFVIGVMGVGGPTASYGPSQQRYRFVHQSFRDAMAAPARAPEFEGNVTAVLTEDYWDAEVSGLREREKLSKPEVDKVKAAMSDGRLDSDAGQAKIEAIYADNFDARELEILKTSTSNFDFHYMGSAGIMARIGKGFAEAMRSLIK